MFSPFMLMLEKRSQISLIRPRSVAFVTSRNGSHIYSDQELWEMLANTLTRHLLTP